VPHAGRKRAGEGFPAVFRLQAARRKTMVPSGSVVRGSVGRI